MDTVGSSMSAMVPALSGMPHYNSDGYGSHLYVPWWMWDKHKELNFPRGYHIEVGGGYGMPGIGSFTGVVNRTEGYGVKMKQAIRDEYGTSVGLSGRGEMIPERAVVLRDRSRGEGPLGHSGAALPLEVERSRAESGPPHAADLPGDPRGRWADRSSAGGRGGRGGAPAIRRRRPGSAPGQAPQTGQAGPQTGQTNAPAGQPTTMAQQAPANGGVRRSRAAARSSTRSARCAWATTRSTSPLNKFCQAHEVKNLFVADAAPFVSNADKNPTHTIVALAWRTAEYLAEELRKGNV